MVLVDRVEQQQHKQEQQQPMAQRPQGGSSEEAEEERAEESSIRTIPDTSVPTYGSHIWDQIPLVDAYTEDGLEQLSRLAEFLRKRSALEGEYARNLQRLTEHYAPPPNRTTTPPPQRPMDSNLAAIGGLASNAGGLTERPSLRSKGLKTLRKFRTGGAHISGGGGGGPLAGSTTVQRGWKQAIAETDKIAKIHQNIAQFMESELVAPLKARWKRMDAERKQRLLECKAMKAELKKMRETLNKVKRNYETACKTSDEARATFEKAEKDLHVTKALLDKLDAEATLRARKAHEADQEYKRELESFNQKQKAHYAMELPRTLNKIQALEEQRVVATQEALAKFAQSFVNVMPELENSYNHIREAAESMDRTVDTQAFLRLHKTEAELPDPVAYENYHVRVAMGHSSSSAADSLSLDLEAMPLEQAFITANHRLDQVDKELKEAERKHAGVQTLYHAYESQPKFADKRTLKKIQEQLQRMHEDMDRLCQEKYKLECFVADRQGTRRPDPPKLFSNNHHRDESGSGSTMSGIGSGSHQMTKMASKVPPQSKSEEEDHMTTSTASSLSFGTSPSGPLQCRGLYDYHGRDENDELAFRAGELLYVLEKDESGWWLARNPQGKTGFVPHNYVQVVAEVEVEKQLVHGHE